MSDSNRADGETYSRNLGVMHVNYLRVIIYKCDIDDMRISSITSDRLSNYNRLNRCNKLEPFH